MLERMDKDMLSISIGGGLIALFGFILLTYYPNNADAQAIAEKEVRNQLCPVKEMVTLTYQEVLSIRKTQQDMLRSLK